MARRIKQIANLILLLLTACTATRPEISNIPPHTNNVPKTAVTPVTGIATGRLVEGYGAHRPIEQQPLWLQNEKQLGDPITTTDDQGTFVLKDLPLGQQVALNSGPLTFQVTVTSLYTTDLGTIFYPLMHPYNYYYWTPYPLQNLSQLLREGSTLPFSVCKRDTTWRRPTETTQQEYVWAHPPFNERDTAWLRSWFRQPALLYDTVDLFHQSFPGGPRLDDLGSGHVYLSGLWSAQFGPFIDSDCDYTPEALTSLLERRQIEVWLLEHRATAVQALSAEHAIVDEASVCDSQDRSCTLRPGYHYAISVEPAEGYQVIRFTGEPGPISVHLMAGRDEITQLP